MSNIYGFDFLRTEHTDADARAALSSSHLAQHSSPSDDDDDDDDDDNAPSSPRSADASSLPQDVEQKTDLEKQFDVLRFLQTHRTSGCLPPSVIYKSTGIDLSSSPDTEGNGGNGGNGGGGNGGGGGGGGPNDAVIKMLLKNPKVRVEEIPDPEDPTVTILTFGYQAKFQNVRDRAGLLGQINRCKNGVGSKDLLDAYDGVEEDLAALVTAGDVLAVANPEDKDRILFPRGEQFLVELDGHVSLVQDVMDEVERLMQKEDEDEATAAAAAAANGTAAGEDQRNPDANKDGGHDDQNGDATPKHGSNSKTVRKDDALVMLALERAAEQRRRALLTGERACLLSIDVDPRKQIRRGEAVWIGGTWFRVSSAVREGVPLSDQPARAQAPPTVALLRDLSKKNDADGYVRPLTDKILPSDRPLPPGAQRNIARAKAARERLHRVAASASSAGGGGGTIVRGATGGPGAQLLSSNAGAANPDVLASQFASVVAVAVAAAAAGGGVAHHGVGGRRRPASSSSSTTTASTNHATGRGGGGSSGAGGGGSVGLGGGGSATEAEAEGGAMDDNATKQQQQQQQSHSNPRINLALAAQARAEAIEAAKSAASDPSLSYLHARRHGCTKDVRDMFLATAEEVPESEVELYQLMTRNKLIEEGEPMRRPRMKKKNPNLDSDGKPKKRRYYERKNQRMTNVHLIGTEIGTVLAKAAEKQSQGKQVGDGGM